MKIDPCPFCGYRHCLPAVDVNRAFIKCGSCGAAGPEVIAVDGGLGAVDDSASIEWNKRELF